MSAELRIIAIRGIGEVLPGADVATLLLEALQAQGEQLHDHDILVVTQKIVSKAEGQVVPLSEVIPSAFAEQIATQAHKDARYQELVLRESRRIVRMQRGVLIVETHHGLVCANAGIDASNVGGGDSVTLLPKDPDRSAAELRASLSERCAIQLAVIITDTFGRPWREGQVNFAIGVAGMQPLRSYIGEYDSQGYELQATTIAIADELAAAAELVMNKIDRVPAAIIRGYAYPPGDGTAHQLQRDPAFDMFR